MDISPSISTLLKSAGIKTENPSPSHLRAAETAKEFEGQFISVMVKEMFQGIGEDDLFNGGTAEENWRELLVDEYAKSIAERGGIGLAPQILSEVIKAQEQGDTETLSQIFSSKNAEKAYAPALPSL